jgi:hypothetical protein
MCKVITAVLISLGSSARATRASADTPVFAGADSVRITENRHGRKDSDTRVISNREQIDAIYRVVLSQSGVWRRPTFDVPFLRWMVEFIRDGRVLGSYGVGSNFLSVGGYLHHLQTDELLLVTTLLKGTSMPP